MPQLPFTVNFAVAAGSQWRQTFTLTDANGDPIDLTGLAWEFVIRPEVTNTTSPALVQVTTTSSSQGQIDVTPLTGTVTVTLTPAATTLLGRGTRPYALWSNPGQTSATTWAAGTFNTQLVARA
jgi:hypothetical protein